MYALHGFTRALLSYFINILAPTIVFSLCTSIRVSASYKIKYLQQSILYRFEKDCDSCLLFNIQHMHSEVDKITIV